jgi:hypothetical protein
MAPSKAKGSTKSSLGIPTKKVKSKVKRKGVVSKKKNSGLKSSKNYRKKYNRQGRK